LEKTEMFNSSSKIWRMQKKRYRLLGVRCESCKKVWYPTKKVCTNCGKGDNLRTFVLSGEGRILSWSLIFAAPLGFENITPYPIALVKLKEGPIILTQITDYEEKDLKIGREVEAVFRKLLDTSKDGVINYGIKFRPILR